MTEDRREYPQRPFTLPDNATEIVIVRHGSSAAHVPGERFEVIEGGHSNPPLAPEGLVQAEQVGARLTSEDLHGIYVTPLQRTHQTAAPLAGAIGIEPVVIPELREVHLGDWEGGEMRVRVANGDPLFGELVEKQRWDVIPGGENMDAFADRVRAGVERIVEQTGPGRRAVAVLHGGVIAEICFQALGGGPRLGFVLVENASVSSLIVHGPGQWRLRSFNDTAHLR
ncbi:MAG TPA: histidine phosphatase family protein [Baekduia sp.]|nr:histidine phosphatase family protein [Baekduia sp.]